MKSARLNEQSVRDHVLTLGRVLNLSADVSEIQTVINEWLDTQNIDYYHQSDDWGILFRCRDVRVCDGRRLLLMSHLDSDEIDQRGTQTLYYDETSRRFKFKDRIGLDDKTGVASVMGVVEALGDISGDGYSSDDNPQSGAVFVYFSLYEEVGQKGSVRVPIELLEEVAPDYVITVDRKSRRHPDGNKRHIVDNYCGVPLLPSISRRRLGRFGVEPIGRLLGRAEYRILTRDEPDAPEWDEQYLPACASVCCSDALEMRGRMDAEVVLPLIIQSLEDLDLSEETGTESQSAADGEGSVGSDAWLTRVLRRARSLSRSYSHATDRLLRKYARAAPEERCCSMRGRTRGARYRCMRKIFQFLYQLPPSAPAVSAGTDEDDESEDDLHELEGVFWALSKKGGEREPLLSRAQARACLAQVVNLSMDYHEPRQSFKIDELLHTIDLLMGAIQS